MNDKDMLLLLEYIEWEGCDDSNASYPEEVIRPVCPYCQGEQPHEGIYFDNTGKGHKNYCQLVKAMIELKKSIKFPDKENKT